MKKIIALALCFVLLFAFTATASAEKGKDPLRVAVQSFYCSSMSPMVSWICS